MTPLDLYILVLVVVADVALLREYRSAIGQNDKLRRDIEACKAEIEKLQEAG